MSLSPGLANIFTTIGRANGPRKCDLRARTRDKRQVGAQGPGLVAVDSWVTNFGLLRRRRGGRLTREGQGQLSRRGPPATPQAKTHGGQNTPPPKSITASRTALTAPRHSGKRTATNSGPLPKSPRSRHKSYSCKGLVLQHEVVKTDYFGLAEHEQLFIAFFGRTVTRWSSTFDSPHGQNSSVGSK